MHTGGDWLRTHKVDGRKVIQYPALSETELLRWLCGPFWEEHGRRLAAESLMLDDEHNDASCREAWGLPPRGQRPKRRRRSSRAMVIHPERRATRPAGEPDSWITLADWLEAEVPVFHGFPHAYDLLRDHGHSFAENEAVNATIRGVDRNHGDSLRPILVKFAQRGEWPREAIEPDIGALIALRIETAARWARTHVLRAGCVVEYPAIPFRRFLRWTLVNWWVYPGRYMASDAIMLMMAADLKR